MPRLREWKKQQNRQAISDAATALFLTAGYEQTSVDAIARAAGVSRRTLFGYFPVKENLVLHRVIGTHEEFATVLRNHREMAPITALHAFFRHGLEHRDPLTGLCDDPELLALHRLITATPVLTNARLAARERAAEALAAALSEVGELRARVAAAQICAVQHVLAEENREHLAAGRSANERYPGALEEAEAAFGLLHHGLRDVGFQAEAESGA